MYADALLSYQAGERDEHGEFTQSARVGALITAELYALMREYITGGGGK